MTLTAAVVSFIIFVAVMALVIWNAAAKAKAQRAFNAKWAAHDIHFDDDRGQWRHDGLCPCGNGPFPIRYDTVAPSGVCHCGADMADHTGWDNHSPVDMVD